MLRMIFAATLLATPSVASAQERFYVIGWGNGSIVQGMSRESVEEVMQQAGHTLEEHPVFGPTVVDGERSYSLVFCDGELTGASWLLPDNTTLLRSMNQRVNAEGFQVVSTSVSGGYNDRSDTENLGLQLLLTHPDGAKAYTVTYNVFPVNGQITLRDRRYGLSCERLETAK